MMTVPAVRCLFKERKYRAGIPTVQFLATGLQKLVLDRPVLDETGQWSIPTNNIRSQ